MVFFLRAKPPRPELIPPTFARAAPAQPPPQSSPLASSTSGDWGTIGSSYYLSPEAIENLSAVVACVSAISGAITSLPATVYRFDQNGQRMVAAPNHPLNAMILNGVNDRESWSDFVETLMGNVLLRGNGLAKIITGRNGNLTGLASIPWALAAPFVTAEGALFFNAVMPYTGQQEKLLNDEVVHLKARSDDTYFGKSPISRAKGAVAASACVVFFRFFSGTVVSLSNT